MRNPNGYGTVYMLPGNRRRPWIARVTLDRDKGRPRYYTVGYYVKQREALKALAKYNEKGLGERGDLTLEQLYDEWSEKKYNKISESTQWSYKGAWKHMVSLKDERIVDIKKSHLQTLVDGIDMSYSSVHKVKVLGTMLWNYAMADDIVDKNYASLVEIKRSDVKEKTIFTDFEIDKINKLAKSGDEWAMTVMILIYTGLRIGELLILTKFSIDLKNKIITGGIKTDAGKDRAVPINAKILPYLKHWHKKSDNLLITRDGDKVTPNYYRKNYWHTSLKKAGVESSEERKLTPHAARHTCATLLSRSGADHLAIQRILGHAQYSTTADMYTRTDMDMLKNAMSKI